VPDDEFEDSLYKCGPHRAAATCGYEIAIFFLTSQAVAKLSSWHEWKEARVFEQMVVPYVEAGYPGALQLTDIEELLEVSLNYRPSLWEQAFAALEKQEGNSSE
jgi:hypothetical protein